MQAEERDPANLWDMIGAARAIVDFTENVALAVFLASGTAKRISRRAVEREPEVLGEAAARIPPQSRSWLPTWQAGTLKPLSSRFGRGGNGA